MMVVSKGAPIHHLAYWISGYRLVSCYIQAWGQVHGYLYLNTFKYTFDSTCTLLKYLLTPAGTFAYLSTHLTVLDGT